MLLMTPLWPLNRVSRSDGRAIGRHFRNRPMNDFNEGSGKRRWINVSQQPVRRNDEIKEAICLNDWREVSVIDKRRPN